VVVVSDQVARNSELLTAVPQTDAVPAMQGSTAGRCMISVP